MYASPQYLCTCCMYLLAPHFSLSRTLPSGYEEPGEDQHSSLCPARSRQRRALRVRGQGERLLRAVPSSRKNAHTHLMHVTRSLPSLFHMSSHCWWASGGGQTCSREAKCSRLVQTSRPVQNDKVPLSGAEISGFHTMRSVPALWDVRESDPLNVFLRNQIILSPEIAPTV